MGVSTQSTWAEYMGITRFLTVQLNRTLHRTTLQSPCLDAVKEAKDWAREEPRGRLSPPWTLSMPSSVRDAPSTDSAVKYLQLNGYIFNNIGLFKPIIICQHEI